jgi:catechol 2,3-dioxygenase-like lactoylglutathione lyase family enzyme
MGLVGVAGLRSRGDEIEVAEGAEALETEDALKRLGPVADGGVKAAPQLPLAEPELGGETVDPSVGMVQRSGGRLHSSISRAPQDEARGERGQPSHGSSRVELAVELAGRVQAELGQGHPEVTDLREGHLESATARARAQSNPNYDLIHARGRDDRAGVRAGNKGASIRPPDDVDAAVRQHPDALPFPAPHPQARHDVAQRRRRWPFVVDVRFVQDRRGTHRFNPRMDILFVASVAVIAPDPAESRRLYIDALGLPLEAAQSSDYWHSERVAGTKHFGVWPLAEAAEACFGTAEWPAHLPVPQASIEFEVADPAAVQAGAAELEGRGYELVHQAREEPWGQTVARLLSPEGLIVGLSFAPAMHGPAADSEA